MTPERRAVVEQVAQAVCAEDLGGVCRVAIDGVTASGKSTLAGEVAVAVDQCGRPAIRLSMDGFHHPRDHRHRQGRRSASGYYEDAYNFAALIDSVLVPLGPGGDRRYRQRVYDLAAEVDVDEPSVLAPKDAVLIVDGTFLGRPDVAPYWDQRVFVDTSLPVARARGIARDTDQLGGPVQAATIYDERYHAACRHYLDSVHPAETASILIHNDDTTKPRLTIHPRTRQ